MPRRYVKRRRYGFPRHRSYRRRAGRIPNMRRPLRAAATAAASTNTSVRMCKDLGALWPGCAIVKLKLNFVSFVGGVAANATQSNNVVQGRIIAYPWRPLSLLSANGGWTPSFNDSGDAAAGVSLITRPAVGFQKLVGTADPSIYLRCATLRMTYRLKLKFMDSNAASNQPGHAVTCIRGYTRPFDNTEALLANPNSETQMDLNLAQPHVRQRYATKTGRITNVNAFTAAPADLPMPEMKMSGSVWPHRTMEIPWGTYVGNDSSFGNSTTNPSDLASLEWAARVHQPSSTTNADTTRAAQYFVWMEGALVFTCLFKDPIGGLT